MVIAIIGSRATPEDALVRMRQVAMWCSSNSIVVRSGKAGGADAAAIYGCMDALSRGTLNATPEMYIPWSGFGDETMTNAWDIQLGDNPIAATIAESIHPAWNMCKQGAKKLHTRNVGQILGKDLVTPSDVVLYWCKEDKNGEPTGGTATAVNLAKKYGIPTANMLNKGWENILRDVLINEE